MSQDVFVIAEHRKAELSDIACEMLGKGRELVDLTGGRLFAVLIGKSIKNLAERMGVADSVICLEDDQLAEFNPEAYQLALAELIGQRQPWLTLIGSTSIGLDLAAWISGRLGIPLVAYCKELRLENGALIATSQLYGGKMYVEVEVERVPAIIAVLPGAFPLERGTVQKAVSVEEVAPKVSLENLRTHFQRCIEPELSEVDIRQASILVSAGRGIQRRENLLVAQELANALGGALSASRPVVDQGWLPLSRQVGKSGMVVKPKLYLAVGISGAPEHVEGMKDSELVIAINTDPKAPIFNQADYGVVGDLFEIVPALTEKLRGLHP